MAVRGLRTATDQPLLVARESWIWGSVQFSSVQSRLTLCDPMNRSTPGTHHKLQEFTQTLARWLTHHQKFVLALS